MKALVYHGPGQRSWEEVPDPAIEQPTDIVVRIETSTICGSDLHILKGDVASCAPGGILGHERVDAALAKGQRQLPKNGRFRIYSKCFICFSGVWHRVRRRSRPPGV